jgi:hypothetical protein
MPVHRPVADARDMAGGWLARLGLSGGARRHMRHRCPPVRYFTGDDGFYYHLAALEPARRCHIPVVLLVNNKSGVGQHLPGVHRMAGGGADRGEELIRYDLWRIAIP